MSVPGVLYIAVSVLTITAAGILLSALGAGKVPAAFLPVANRWQRAGRDPKWIRYPLWFLFFSLALTVVAMIVIPVYPSVLQLGKKWNS